MSRTLDIIGAVRQRLLAVHPRVWPERAPDGAAYPYLIINLPNSFDDGDIEQFVLDVDGWDVPTNGSPAALETMMAAADDALNKQSILTGSDSFVVYRDNRLTLEDDDKRIRRRKYIYQVHAQ